MQPDHKSASYLCQSCGKFYTTSIQVSTTCTHCECQQTSLDTWRNVISKRSNGLIFEQIESTTNSSIAKSMLKDEKKVDAKLDFVGSKKARRTLIVSLIVGLIILAGLAISFNTLTNILVQSEDPPSTIDGSLTIAEENEWKNIGYKCIIRLNQFLGSDGIFDKVKHVYSPDIDQIELFYLTKKHEHSRSIVNLTKLKVISRERANIVFTDSLGRKIEAAFIKDKGQWLLDWKHFVNKGTMPFDQFLSEKPSDTHSFRLYFTENKYGSFQQITLLDTQPNNILPQINEVSSVSMSVDQTNPQYSALMNLIKTSKNYAIFNKTLSSVDVGSFGSRDPFANYRVNISLKWIQVDGDTVLKIEKINAAHWLDESFDSFLLPSQKLINATN